MKLTKVFLRWYKSFNVSYDSLGADRHASATTKPWNEFKHADGSSEVYPFIEIPIENDITTIVGANESGKSHLLSAISKVVNNTGVPGDPFSVSSKPGSFNQTDLCHFSSLLSKNLDTWPEIGLQFSVSHDSERERLNKATGHSGPIASFILIVSGPRDGETASLYINNSKIGLSADGLNAVRACLPKVYFIKSQVPIADQVSLASLIRAYGGSTPGSRPIFEHHCAQQAASFLTSLSIGTTVDQGTINSINTIKQQLQLVANESPELELKLFREILGITLPTLETLYALTEADRSHAEALMTTWNNEIESKLNLSKYWQQDQRFSLCVNFKNEVLYFEITDKTGAVYTFKERSSGLRYFLSYYIQARALESLISSNDSAIILMDEPDSFLSVLGQRNLLSIFESLISADTSRQNIQLIYTTHSPFLINRNFPRRLRLVKKGDAEEGTQYIDQSRIRRFEPVRSALGIDLAQTLFMGATNIILEGPTEQYLLTEMIRRFSGTEGATDLLNLNQAVMVSAESAPAIEQMLVASRWSDEPIPTAIVFVDADSEGIKTKERITGKLKGAEGKGVKQLIDPRFVMLINEVIKPYGKNIKILSFEDVIPVSIFKSAITKYLVRWHDLDEEKRKLLDFLDESSLASEGIDLGTKKVFQSILSESGYDKLGVMTEVIAIVSKLKDDNPDLIQLKKNIVEICRALKERIEESESAERKRSGTNAVRRIIGDFFIRHKNAAATFEIKLLLDRLSREAESFGRDSDRLQETLSPLKEAIEKMRAAGLERLIGNDWAEWHDKLDDIRKNPLASTKDVAKQSQDLLHGAVNGLPPALAISIVDKPETATSQKI